jgi:hypothetical protein
MRTTGSTPLNPVTTHAHPPGNRGQPPSVPLNIVQLWRRRESNLCERSEQKRETTRTYPPNPRNRLDKSLPFAPAPIRMMPPDGAESGHKEGPKFGAVSSGEARLSLSSRVNLGATMSRPEKLIPSSLEEAVAELKRDPSHPVHARVDGLDVEVRVLPSNETSLGAGSRLAAIGPWEGIALEELDRILREGREAGGSAPAPDMP